MDWPNPGLDLGDQYLPIGFDDPNEISVGPPATDRQKKKSQRLAKNRESARNSRRRKKAYLQTLEEKVAMLTDELNDLKRE
jgi:hypothetical protein